MAQTQDDSLTVLTSITHRTLSYETYAILKQSILNLELAPGAPIDETRVALRLGVSKTPVREAIARLEGERLVVSMAGKRSYVADIAPQTIREMFKVRMLLEASSLSDITPTLTDTEIDQIGQLLDPGGLTTDLDDMFAFVNWNERFHTCLIRFSDNEYLVDVVGTLLDQSRRAAAAILRSEQHAAIPALLHETVERHTAIHAAIVRRDATCAADLMRADIRSFLRLLDQPGMQAAFEALSAAP